MKRHLDSSFPPPSPSLCSNEFPSPIRLQGKQAARQEVLLAFRDPAPTEFGLLKNLSAREWRHMLRWLDTSGLALYFFDRLIALGRTSVLPEAVLQRLRQNMTDSRERTEDMLAEAAAIHRAFQAADLTYATLKGFSLWPHSVPKMELRSQLDHDFLIAAKDAPSARRLLEARGYRLHAISGRSWEFKTPMTQELTLEQLYKPATQRCVELHLETSGDMPASLLARRIFQPMRLAHMPVLQATDLFLGQGMHAFKHIRSESQRTAHLVEFRRHVLARRDDAGFWAELEALAGANSRAVSGLGLTVHLISTLMGEFAPEALTRWTVVALPLAERLWVERYGARVVFADFPGNKLYLLLQRELDAGGPRAKRTVMQALLPRRLPPSLAKAPAGEAWPERLRRYQRQLHFILFRLRFHIVEGLRYLRERRHWQRHLASLREKTLVVASVPCFATPPRPQQSNDNSLTEA